MTDLLTVLELSSRVGVAVLLGGAIGLERQWRLRTAGIRTNALVASGSALFVIVGVIGSGGHPTADPTRVAAQVVSGIGFLGAGVILRDGFNIRGLTTAATLWCAAAVGSLAGAGFQLMAAIGCIAIVATNTLLRPLSSWVNRRGRHPDAPGALVPDTAEYMFEVITTERGEPRVRALVLQMIDKPEYVLRSLDVRPGKSSQVRVVAGISSSHADTAGLQNAVHRISLDPKVISSRWWAAEDED